MEKKIKWETLHNLLWTEGNWSNVTSGDSEAICDSCDYRWSEIIQESGCDESVCPIWASLEDVGETQESIMALHHGQSLSPPDRKGGMTAGYGLWLKLGKQWHRVEGEQSWSKIFGTIEKKFSLRRWPQDFQDAPTDSSEEVGQPKSFSEEMAADNLRANIFDRVIQKAETEPTIQTPDDPSLAEQINPESFPSDPQKEVWMRRKAPDDSSEEVEVGQCDNCGQGLYHKAEEMDDGTPLICGDCKTIHWFSSDGDDGGYINTEGETQTPDEPDVYEDGGEDDA